jgi:hypothetical protein
MRGRKAEYRFAVTDILQHRANGGDFSACNGHQRTLEQQAATAPACNGHQRSLAVCLA